MKNVAATSGHKVRREDFWRLGLIGAGVVGDRGAASGLGNSYGFLRRRTLLSQRLMYGKLRGMQAKSYGNPSPLRQNQNLHHYGKNQNLHHRGHEGTQRNATEECGRLLSGLFRLCDFSLRFFLCGVFCDLFWRFLFVVFSLRFSLCVFLIGVSSLCFGVFPSVVCPLRYSVPSVVEVSGVAGSLR